MLPHTHLFLTKLTTSTPPPKHKTTLGWTRRRVFRGARILPRVFTAPACSPPLAPAGSRLPAPGFRLAGGHGHGARGLQRAQLPVGEHAEERHLAFRATERDGARWSERERSTPAARTPVGCASLGEKEKAAQRSGTRGLVWWRCGLPRKLQT